MTKTARVYKIEMLIRNRGNVSFQNLLDELEVSPATLKRDLDYLKDQLGAPIKYDRFLNGYRFGEEYRGQKHELPGLWFSERELYSLLMAHQLLSELDSEGVISRHLHFVFRAQVNAVPFGRVRLRLPSIEAATRGVAEP